MSLDLLTYRRRPAAAEPAGALVVLHGRGADEHDLEPLLDALDPERRLAGFLPRGPLTLPPGGYHWYVVREVGFPDPATFLPTFERLSAWVDAVLAETGVPVDRLVLAGFSQGAVMAYSLGLAAERARPAAILAFSGFVPRVEGFELDLAGRAGLPVAVAHGALDPIIRVEFGRDARERLTAAGLDVVYREDPIPHAISPDGLAQAKAVLERALAEIA
ncbi:MAG: phospholipase [Actinomycetota bacterium]|nr:phospholipase [Actinomycetota bacterium]